MWVWSYPHLILFILASIYKVSCQEKSSLTFVIDNTYSMADDIAQVKENVNGISQIVFEERASQIKNMVLVTFNDPAASLMTVTEDRNYFKAKIHRVNVHGGGDCPEMSMTGILKALDASLPGSFIYVFTDASAKDYYLSGQVKNMCQKKQSQIVFILTGFCYSRNEEMYQVYYDIATACSGLAFNVNKNEVKKVLATIKETIKGNKAMIVATKTKPNIVENVTFTLDDKIEYAIVSASGQDVSLKVSGPGATPETLLSLKNVKVIKLSDPTPGKYVATVKGSSETSVNIVGRTDFFFQHGFSELEPKSLKDTTPQPIVNTQTLLSVSVTDPKHTVHIIAAQILDLKDRIVNSLLLRQISRDFYTTQPFIAPTKRFKIAVLARDVKTGKYITRIAKLSITPQEPPRVLPKSKVPEVTISEGNTIEATYGQRLKLTCKVTAYPEPDIEWYNARSVPIKSQRSVVEPPYKYISYLEMSRVVNNASYTCRSRNNEGNGSAVINVIVKEPFVVKSAIKGITKIEYGTKGVLRCDITASVPMRIRWYSILKKVGARQELVTSDKYTISNDGTTLTINKMDLYMAKTYSCEASLAENEHIRSIHRTQVQISGLTMPQVTGDDNIKAVKGSSVDITCHVTGTPAPTITWLFKAEGNSEFVSIYGSQNVLHKSRVEDYHAGTYKCIARNVLGEQDHQTTLHVLIPPNIVTSSTSAYTSVEGKDAVMSIPCTATGLPKPVIIWTVDGARISESTKHSIKDGTLIIREPKVSDTGSYTCLAQNDAGATRASFQANIFQTPEISGDKSKIIKKGDSTKIKCDVVKGVPRPSIKWYFKAKSSSEFVPLTGRTELNIEKADKTHTGTYKCVAQNVIGSSEHLTDLTVEFAPTILSDDSRTLTGVESDVALRIPCDTDGVPTPSITWKVNGEIIVTSAKYIVNDDVLIINKPNKTDSNSYTCEAKNYLGHDSATFKVNVQSFLDDYGPKETVNVLLGEEVKLECGSTNSTQSVTWYLEGENTGIKGNYYHLRNVQMSSEGNYTCRVSDASGTRTKTYVLIVGYPPVFSDSEPEPLYDWSGSENDVLDCEAEAKPAAIFTWTYNGKLLQGMNSSRADVAANWGHYTCNVSNVHGTITRSFDVISSHCLISRKPENIKAMPLILSPTSTFPALSGTTNYLIVEPGETVKFSCPNAKHKIKNETEAICDKQDIFTVQGIPHKVSDLQCAEESDFIIKNRHIKCLSETSELIRVGFEVHGFLETYEVCFDVSKRIPLFTRAVMSKSSGGPGTTYNWKKYPETVVGTEDKTLYTCENSMSTNCYSKTQLVNVRDFVDGPAQRSTFIDPLNAVPCWRPSNMAQSPWDSIESVIRTRLNIFDEFIAWSGTHTVEKMNGGVIPRYLWKVLRFDEDQSIAIVYVNGPSPSTEDILCKNTCPDKQSVPWFNEINSYIYCCELDDFLRSFNLRDTTVGESMEAALDKTMSKKY
ncbi:unnamed protein product [Arctia plantaginis]|uniref:Hemolin n=1 Tax=Arctia plantaginis TaxID=874455 RepID=A0A8S0ZHS1_ARCPL|nr:unnamed protein product [Arctia plantaginis]